MARNIYHKEQIPYTSVAAGSVSLCKNTTGQAIFGRTVPVPYKILHCLSSLHSSLFTVLPVPGLHSVTDPDPGSGAFLTPGSGTGRKSASGSGIQDEQPGSNFLELRNHFVGFF